MEMQEIVKKSQHLGDTAHILLLLKEKVLHRRMTPELLWRLSMSLADGKVGKGPFQAQRIAYSNV